MRTESERLVEQKLEEELKEHDVTRIYEPGVGVTVFVHTGSRFTITDSEMAYLPYSRFLQLLSSWIEGACAVEMCELKKADYFLRGFKEGFDMESGKWYKAE